MISEWINNGKGMKKENKQFVVFLTVMVILGGSIGIIGGLNSTNTKPNMDPCDCYQLFNKETMIGFSNLQKLEKYSYNDCVKVWDNSKKANDGCLKKMGIE